MQTLPETEKKSNVLSPPKRREIDAGKIPKALRELPHWLVWRQELVDGRKTKVPYQAHHPKRRADTTKRETLSTFNQALIVATTGDFDGIGYVFMEDDPHAGVDLDKCVDPITGVAEAWTAPIIKSLNSYTELSPSGTGYHVHIKATVPPGGNKKGKVEMYSRARFFTFTGWHLEGTPATVEDRQSELEALHRKVFGKPQEAPRQAPRPTNLSLTDFALIDKAKSATNGHLFSALWNGDTGQHGGDDSAADLALCRLLAFYTGPDPGRIDAIFRQSGLMREKWERPDYRDRTINKALAGMTEFYGQAPTRTPDAAPDAPRPEAPTTRPTTPPPKLNPITARELGAKTFAPARWTVPNLIPEGLTVLAAKPKSGKSWLCLNISMAITTAGLALGSIQVERGEALYLALEDGPRRIQERLNKMAPGGPLPDGLHILTASQLPPLYNGGLDALDAWLGDHPAVRLCVIDTLARIKPPRGRHADSYDHDSEIVGKLQGLAIKHRIGLILVHHTRKQATDDFLESVGGTFGITGVADAVAVLIRTSRGTYDAKLKITGRDLADTELALQFCPDIGSWQILGDAEDFASTPERQQILVLLRETGPQTIVQIATILDKKYNSVHRMLARMVEAGELTVNNVSGLYNV